MSNSTKHSSSHFAVILHPVYASHITEEPSYFKFKHHISHGKCQFCINGAILTKDENEPEHTCTYFPTSSPTAVRQWPAYLSTAARRGPLALVQSGIRAARQKAKYIRPSVGCCQEHVSGLPLIVIFTKTNNVTVIFLYFCGRIPWQLPVLVGWVYGAVVFCPGAPQGSTGSGSDSKASQKTGPLVYKT